MQKIEIIKTNKGFNIRQGDLEADMLSWDEMMGVVAELTMPEEKHCLNWMRPKCKKHEI